MGKIKTVVMGDIVAEEAARKKAEVKREQKHVRQAQQKKEDKNESKKERASVAAKEDIVENEQALVDTEIKNEQKGAEKSQEKTSKSAKSTKLDKYHFTPGKKYAAAISLVDKSKTHSLSEALDLVKKTSFSKFDGSVELHINVSDKGLRGNVTLPHGTGKNIRVKIADDKLIADLSTSPKIDFDILVASPDMMPKLAKIAKILGPRGLMPNPKTNTISANPEQLVKILSSSIQWKTQNDFPIIHAVIGKVSFDEKKLEENFNSLIKSIGKDKIRSLFIKPTMGPSINLSL